MLRSYGSTLPVEIWLLLREMDARFNEVITSLGDVRVMVFEDHVADPSTLVAPDVQMHYGKAKPFHLKPLAMLLSSFEELLFLDADNTPVRDVAYLFDHSVYTSSGYVMWPNNFKTSPRNPIWEIIDTKPRTQREGESGQILVNKRQRWQELNMFLHFCGPFYMRLYFGDKDAQVMSCAALKSPCHMMRDLMRPAGRVLNEEFFGMAFLQHGFNGEIGLLSLIRQLISISIRVLSVFVHHNSFKLASELPKVFLDKMMLATRGNEDLVRFKHIHNARIADGPAWYHRLEGIVPGLTEVLDSGLEAFSQQLKTTWQRIHEDASSGNH